MPAPRYAIYFVPGCDTPLYRFGASVLGYDCYDGTFLSPIDGVDAAEWAAVVETPCIYGFHATLKAPFVLADGRDESELRGDFLSFAREQPSVNVGELVLRELESFVALVPKAQDAPLARLAETCVEEFDRFRAPLSAADRERRLQTRLTRRQADNLERWGYPYVFDDFRFHMTLTGSLESTTRKRVLSFLCHKYDSVRAPLTISQIVLVRQADRTEPFQVVETAELGHSPCRPYAYSF